MKINEIIIKNFKSIKFLRFEMHKKGNPLSYTNILIGKNGSGKSNILEAISLPDRELNNNQDFLKLSNKHTKDERLEILYDLNLTANHNHIGYILKETSMPNELAKQITFQRFIRHTILEHGKTSFQYDVDYKIKRNLQVNNYKFASTTDLKQRPNYTSKYNLEPSIKYLIIEKKKVPQEDQDMFETLTYDSLTSIIQNAVNEYAKDMIIPIDYWEPSNNYLLNDRINLMEFSENLDNIPMQNLLKKCGYTTTEEIQTKINDAKKNRTEKQKLVKELTLTLNQYLSNSLKEYDVEADISLSDELDLDIFIKDKNDELNVFTMDERSEGFKHYLSFLLSLGIGNDAGSIQDRIILIDEPENHLHPSSIRSMKEQLINLGLNNYVFMSTHSNYMLDTTPGSQQRHYIVYKDNECNTHVHNVKANEDIYDEEILLSAFGFDIFDDILPRKILLVEGKSDKAVIEYALSKTKEGQSIKVIPCLSASKMPNTAGYFTNKNSKVIALTDDDPAGNEALVQLEEKVPSEQNNYLNLNKILHGDNNLKTIEDILPKQYIVTCLKKSDKKLDKLEISLSNEGPVEKQIRKELHIYLNEHNINKDVEKIIKSFKTQITKNIKLLENENITKLNKLASAIKKEFK